MFINPLSNHPPVLLSHTSTHEKLLTLLGPTIGQSAPRAGLTPLSNCCQVLSSCALELRRNTNNNGDHYRSSLKQFCTFYKLTLRFYIITSKQHILQLCTYHPLLQVTLRALTIKICLSYGHVCLFVHICDCTYVTVCQPVGVCQCADDRLQACMHVCTSEKVCVEEQLGYSSSNSALLYSFDKGKLFLHDTLFTHCIQV